MLSGGEMLAAEALDALAADGAGLGELEDLATAVDADVLLLLPAEANFRMSVSRRCRCTSKACSKSTHCCSNAPT